MKQPKNEIPREILLTDLVHLFEGLPAVGGKSEHYYSTAKMNVKE